MKSKSIALLVSQIVEIIRNDSATNFLRTSEKRVSSKLKVAYREFAKDYGFSLKFEICGMLAGTHSGFSDYLISTDEECTKPGLDIWVNCDDRVQIDIPNKRSVKVARLLRKLIIPKGIRVVLAHAEDLKKRGELFLAQCRDVDVH